MIVAVALAAIAATNPVESRIHPMMGRWATYKVQKGETLLKIARKSNLSVFAMFRANGLKSTQVKPGKELIMPSLHVLPRTIDHGIVLNLPERAVYVFKGGQVIGRYGVAIGQSDPKWHTISGDFRLAQKTINPTWHPPKSMVEAGEVRDEPVPPGGENPLGDRWMGWSKSGFGFHSTRSPRSIGRAASHGCVRLYPERAHEIFDKVAVGMPIYSIYEPMLIGKRKGVFYLSVFPDVYNQGLVSWHWAYALLEKVGLLPLVDEARVRSIVARAPGLPIRIAGLDEPLEALDKPLQSPIAPSLVHGFLAVPVRPVVEAFGGKLEMAGKEIVIHSGTRQLRMTLRQKHAMLDGRPINAVPAPTRVEEVLVGPLQPMLQRVEEVLVGPLQPMLQLFGARLDWQKGRAIRLVK